MADPYEGSQQALIFDLVVVLNYFETICVEVQLGHANEKSLCSAVGVTIVGARDKLLTRLDELLEEDQTAAYSALVDIAERFRPTILEAGGQLQIPDPKDEEI